MRNTKAKKVQAPTVAAPATTVIATPPGVANLAAHAAGTAGPAPTYTLNPAAATLAAQGAAAGLTLQAPSKGLGKAWRVPNHRATNTRALALAAIMAQCGSTFTHAQAQAALASAKAAGAVHLGSGTPASYCKAFVKNGYFAPSA